MPMVLTRDVKPDSSSLKDEVLKGIRFPSTAYNTGRRRELAYLIAITKAFNLDQLNDPTVNHSAGWQHRRDRAAPAAVQRPRSVAAPVYTPATGRGKLG